MNINFTASFVVLIAQFTRMNKQNYFFDYRIFTIQISKLPITYTLVLRDKEQSGFYIRASLVNRSSGLYAGFGKGARVHPIFTTLAT